MKGFKAVFKRELYAFFASPIFYVVGTIFLALSGYFFYTSVAYFSLISFQAAQNPYMAGQVNINEMVIKPLFDDMSIILLLIVPLLTMRLLAEEKKTGTIELLLTYPIRELAILLGKYLATLLVILVFLAATVIYMFLLSWVGRSGMGACFNRLRRTGINDRRLCFPGPFCLGPDPKSDHCRRRRIRGLAHVLDHRLGRFGLRAGGRQGGQLSFFIGTSGPFYQRGAGYPGSDLLSQFFGVFYFFDLTLSGFEKDQRINRIRIADFGLREKKK